MILFTNTLILFTNYVLILWHEYVDTSFTNTLILFRESTLILFTNTLILFTNTKDTWIHTIVILCHPVNPICTGGEGGGVGGG